MLTTEEFIRRSSEKHNGKFDYSLSVYTGKDNKILIICPKHGQIEQYANAHMRGFGCAKCAAEQSGKNRTHTKDQFVEKAKSKYGDLTFDYSKVEYINSVTPVKIICKKHNYEFLVPPHVHIAKHPAKKGGCRLCRIDSTVTSLKKGKDFYLPKILEAIDSKYILHEIPADIEHRQKITLLCPEHGMFDIRVCDLLKGSSCRKCATYGFNLTSKSYFYILKVTDHVIKFGITSDITRRLYQINRESCFDCCILHFWQLDTGEIAKSIEDAVKFDPSIRCCVVNKCDMGTGYKETTYATNLPKILQIVENFTNASSS